MCERQEKKVHLPTGGNSSDFFFLAMAQQRLGNPQAARQWYEKGIQWMAAHAPKDPELARFRAEAGALTGLAATTATVATSPASRASQ